jgi:hypothetical protein
MSIKGIKDIKCTVLYVSLMTFHYHLLSSSLWPCNRYKEYEPVAWIFILLRRVFGTRPYYPYLLCLPKSHLNRVSSANRESANFRTIKICYICGPSASVAICGFVIFGPNIFCDVRTCDFRTQFYADLKLP